MAAEGNEVSKVGVGELRGIIVDSEELKKGTKIFDEGGLKNLARYGNKLFCEAAGSGPSPYKVTLAFGDGAMKVKARCTCPSAMRRPFCKHAAALLVAWSRAPEAFVASEGAPAGARDAGGKKPVKTSPAQREEEMKQGVKQIATLVRELGVAGVSSGAEGWAAQIKRVGEALRDFKLRRLGAKTLDLAALLERAALSKSGVPAAAYTELLTDLRLTQSKLDKHLGGEPIEDRHREELIGKTWTKADRKPVSGLSLVEIAFRTWTTSDEFIIRESRFFDLSAGGHYSEKQIVPARFSQEPKRSWAGRVLDGMAASLYPGYAPSRVEITDLGNLKALDQEALNCLIEKALPDVGSALAALHEHRKDVFAPDLVPVALRVDTLFSRGDRMQAVDEKGHALHLPYDPQIEIRLGTALREGRLRALIGDLGIDAALPTLAPLAVVIEGPLGLSMRTLVDPGMPSDKRSKALPAPDPGTSGWAAAARAAGASAAAIALGEVREELAEALVLGLTTLSTRVTDPLVSRLRDLSLEKPAALLASLPQKPDPVDRLDDFIKLYQVLGIALLRLAGATEVDRAAIERVPTYESVFVRRPEAFLVPAEVQKQRAEGSLNRYEAALHYDRHYAGLPAEELCENIHPTWADGSASPYVVRAMAGRGEAGIEAAKRALGEKRGKVAKITAIRVLGAIGGPTADHVLAEVARTAKDAGLRALAMDARDALDLRRFSKEIVWRKRMATDQRVSDLSQALLTAPSAETREAAIHQIGTEGLVGAIPALRQAFLADAAQRVRDEAAVTLGMLGDTEMAETFIWMLKRRDESPRDAAAAIKALGHLGDVRGIHELLKAWAEGYRPKDIAEALKALGPAAIGPMIETIEAQPEIAARKSALDVLRELSELEIAAALVARVEKVAGADDFTDRAQLYLKLAAVHVDCRRVVGQAILNKLPAEKHKSPLGKAAMKAAI
ncbi:MAG: HEAT repeat domain-containing protein [Byssovorax sp.]